MDVSDRVEAYLASQPEPKQTDLRTVHSHVLAEFPECRLWFNDGTNQSGKLWPTPTSATASTPSPERQHDGHSVYVLGLEDKTYLARTYSASIGKASVTGYCIKFTRLSLINDDALQAAIRYGMTVDKRPGAEPTRP